MAHVPGTFIWFECSTTDAAAAKSFYTKVFGWDAVDTPMPGGMPGTYTMLRKGDADVAGLYQMDPEQFAGIPSHWATYVNVADVDQAAAKVEKLGGKVMGPVMDVPEVGRIAFIEDPTGGKVGMFAPGGHDGSVLTGESNTFGWNELQTRDTEAAKVFYAGVFDWTPKASTNPEMPYTEFEVDGKSVGGMLEMTPEMGEAPPNWMPYVFVDDCDATVAKATEAGGTTIVPPFDVPNVGRMSMFLDPSGAALSVIKMAEQAG